MNQTKLTYVITLDRLIITMRIFLDDIRKPSDVGLNNKEWVVIPDAITAWQAIRNGVVEELSLDHDLGEGPTGYDLCKWMAENNKWPSKSIYIHSQNPVGRNNMWAIIKRYYLKTEE